MEIHAYTSFSYSYLDRARVWAKSLKRIHPDWIIWALIIDKEPHGFTFNLDSEPFDKLISIEDLSIVDVNKWLFGLNVVEACTAVKGEALKYIFKYSNAEKILYFDPDTAVFNSMNNVIELLETYSIILTPHQIDPESSDSKIAIFDNEVASLKYGSYNLGFIAVNNDKEGNRFAKWWSQRLLDYCHDNLEAGLFVDQKWCNLVPCFFDRVLILRDPGYNVASWNLSQRKITIDIHGVLNVNNVPLRFFHFTKLGPVGDLMTSRYAKNNIEVYEIWSAYKRWVANENEKLIPTGYWFYSKFSNGVSINNKLRIIYRSRKDLQDFFHSPQNMYEDFIIWLKSEDLVNLINE